MSTSTPRRGPKENDKAKATPMDRTLDLVEQEIQRAEKLLSRNINGDENAAGSLA